MEQDQPVTASSSPKTSTDVHQSKVEEQPSPLENLPKEIQSIQATAHTFTDRALHFLSNANNETLGACIVGLSAATYVVLGRFGLVLIGVVGGVVLQATWEGSRGGSPTHITEERRRRETGLEVASRVLKWRLKPSEGDDSTEDDHVDLAVVMSSGKVLDYSDFRPETAAALNELTDAVIRDYVKWWYSPVLPDQELFPTTCRQIFTAFMLSVSAHLSRKRPADAFLDFTTRSSSIVIIFLTELSAAINASPNSSAPNAVDSYLEMKPDCNLATIVDKKYQTGQLELVAEDILQNYLDVKTYNCRPAHVFLREILSKLIIEMTIQACSKPEWINGWIVYLLEDGEPELMNAIDAGVEGSAGKKLETIKAQVLASEEASAEKAKEITTNDNDPVMMHRRTISKEDEAVREELKQLNLMIKAEQAKREEQHRSNLSLSESISGVSEATSTTHGIPTPTSSQDGSHDEPELTGLRIVDADGPRTPNLSSKSEEVFEFHSPPAATEPTKPSGPKTTFDELVPSQPMTAFSTEKKEPPPLTLHNASVSIFDDPSPNDRGVIRTKPTVEYFIQIEPKSSYHSGWISTRKYAEFETLHEVLRRISVVSGLGFTEAHSELPSWKSHTRASLRGELERYVNAACSFKALAESESMKRFLEKDKALARTPSGNGGIVALEAIGQGMLNASKEVAGGGRALLGGITGVIGLGPKKTNTIPASPARPANGSSTSSHQRAESTVSPLPTIETRGRAESTISPLPQLRKSQDSLRNLPVVDMQPTPIPQMERRPSYNPDEARSRPSTSSRRSSVFGLSSRDHSRAPSRSSLRESVDLSPVMGGDQILNLPPPPTEIADDFNPNSAPLSPLRHTYDPDSMTAILLPTTDAKPKPPPAPRAKPPITEPETQTVVDLLFAIINELYTLSSAWNIRKTLLTAAKTFLLRPGNPQLESIRSLLQDTVLDANTSDAGLAAHVRKLRENALPTEAELKAWPKPMADEEKEVLRVKARKLLVERGMPVALTGVMGQAATGEALGRVFDCLQVEKVARGLVFGLVLQAARGVTH